MTVPVEVRAEGIGKTYGRDDALTDVSLTVPPGALVALLGPSGSGKTTLLRVIAGLEVPDRGRILFGGEDATDLPVRHRRVGFVFQHYALFRHMSVSENVAYGLRSRPRASRPDRAEIDRRVRSLLELVQLPALADRKPAQLSGGQRQRVALARALAVEPRVLLLDEPFGALDAQVRRDLRRWLRDVHDRTGQTTVFVTHDQDEALELADQVAILQRGRLEQVGSPDEIQDAPASAFVCGFVGGASRLDVTVGGGQAFLGGHPLPVGVPAGLDGAATLFCRPWEVDLVAPGLQGSATGTVRAIRRVGGGRRAEVELPGGERLEADLPAGSDLAPGGRTGIVIRSGRVFARDG